MLFSRTRTLFSLALTLATGIVTAGLFTKGSGVTMLDAQEFKKVMNADETSMVAFVAPWCGHCQRMTPEFSKAAKSLSPLIPFYAVDCDDEGNKPLCAEQGVQGFPTVKVFPRGKHVAPILYEGERTANAFVRYVSLRVPTGNNAKLSTPEDVNAWIKKTAKSNKLRAVLFTKEKKVPLLWKVLAHRFKDRWEMAIHKDEEGTTAAEVLKRDASPETKVVVFTARETVPLKYLGETKLAPLAKHFQKLIEDQDRQARDMFRDEF